MDPHNFGKPDPHQLKIRIQMIADDKPKCMEYEPIRELFQGFERLFGS
jgi:hypothetical protein